MRVVVYGRNIVTYIMETNGAAALPVQTVITCKVIDRFIASAAMLRL